MNRLLPLLPLLLLLSATLVACASPQTSTESTTTAQEVPVAETPAAVPPSADEEPTELTYDLEGLWEVDMEYVIRHQPDMSPEEREFMLEMMDGSSMSLEFRSDNSLVMSVAMMDEQSVVLGTWSFRSQRGDTIVVAIVSDDDPEQIEEEVALHIVDDDSLRMEGDDGGMLLLVRQSSMP